MKRTFIYADAKSHKFWSIEASGNSYTVRYGKVGSDGQTQVKEFADEATCLLAVEKILAEKTKKGYVEEGGDMPENPSKTAKQEKEPEKSASTKEKKAKESKEPKAEVVNIVGTGDRDHRQFLYQDGLSSKFWNIERDGAVLNIEFGAVGKKGRTTTKMFESDDRAAKEMVKALNKKVNESYMEVTEGAVPLPDLSEYLAYVTLPINIVGEFWIDVYDLKTPADHVEDQARVFISGGSLGDFSEEQIDDTIKAIHINREKRLQIEVLTRSQHEKNIAIFTPELVKKPVNKSIEILAPKNGKITKKLIKQMIDAIQDNRVEDVRTLLNYGVTANDDDRKVYAWTIVQKNLEIIKLVIPTLNDYTPRGSSVYDMLSYALLSTNNYDVIKTAIDAGFDFRKDPHFFESVGPIRDLKIADLVFSIYPLTEDKEGKAMIAALLYDEHIDLINYLLDHKANLNGYDYRTGDFVMHYVVNPLGMIKFSLDQVKKFVDAGASLSVKNLGNMPWGETDDAKRTGGGLTPLMKALANSVYDYQPKVPDEIQEYIRQLNNSDTTVEQAFRAARDGSLIILKDFARKNKLDVRDANGATLLHHVMLQKDNTQNIVCADYLVSQGVDVNAVDNQNRTPLFYADLLMDYYGNANIIKYLADKGADVNHEDVNGLTPIMFHTIDRPIRPTSETNDNTPHESIYTGRAFALKSLTYVGADLNRTFKDGKNIFHHLLTVKTFFEDDEILEFMMKKGGDVNHKDNLGRTPMHYIHTPDYCGINGRIDACVKSGNADLNVQDLEGNTPLHLLLLQKNSFLGEHLIRHGANPTIPNNEGKTAEDLMREFGFYESMSSVLKEYHATPPEVRTIEHKWKSVEIKTPQTKFDRLNMEIVGSLLLPEAEYRVADSLFTAGKNRIIGRDFFGRYSCIDSLTGKFLWVGKPLAKHERAFYSEQDDVLYSGHHEKEVAAVNPATGEILWTTFIAQSHYTFQSPFVEYKNLLVFHSNKSVYAVNKDTHKVQWKMKFNSELGKNKFNIWKNLYIVQNTQGGLPVFHIINMDSGLVERTHKAERGYKDYTNGFVVENQLWYLSDDGSICRLNLETGIQEDIALVTKHLHDPRALVVNSFNYVNNKFYFDISLLRHDGEEDGLYVCSEDMEIQRVSSGEVSARLLSGNAGAWPFSKSKLHGTTLYYTLQGKIVSLSLEDFTEKTLDIPVFSGLDIIESNLCIHDDTMFITQRGGNEHKDRQIIWIIQ